MGATGDEHRKAPDVAGPDVVAGGPRSGEPAEPVVRPGTAADAPAAALLHVDRIAEGFLSFLGPGFLTLLYRRITATPGVFLVVAEVEGVVVGFVAGAADVGALYRSFLRHDGLRAVWGSLGRLARHWRRALETLRHGTGPGEGGAGEGTELLAIAVASERGGQGVGAALVDAFLARVADTGGRSASVVVAAGNARAIALYERAGFRRSAELELHAGTTSLLLGWDAQADRPAPGRQ